MQSTSTRHGDLAWNADFQAWSPDALILWVWDGPRICIISEVPGLGWGQGATKAARAEGWDRKKERRGDMSLVFWAPAVNPGSGSWVPGR